MRPLTSTLLAAQQGLAFVPYVRLTRRRCSAWEDRYQPVAGPAGPGTQPAVCAGAGKLNCLYLSGGALKLYQLTGGVPPTGGVTSTIASTADTLVAAAQSGSTIAVVTAAAGAWTFSVRLSSNNGASWAAAETVSLSGLAADAIQRFACSWNASGTKLLIASEGATRIACVVRTGPGAYNAAVVSADAFTLSGTGYGASPGIACAYARLSGVGDWVLLVSYVSAGLYTVNSYVFGDGDQVAAGTLTTRQAVLAVQPYNTTNTTTAVGAGSTLAVAGGAPGDVLRFTIVENTRNPVTGLSSFRNYLMTCQGAASARVGAVRDPQALPVDSSQPLLPAFDPSTSTMYWANATTIYYAAGPTTQDLSSRVLHVTRVQEESAGHVDAVLDNADGSLTALAQTLDAAGEKLTCDFGYVTAAGAEYSSGAPLFVTNVDAVSHLGLATLSIRAVDGWALLTNWRPRRLYSWIAGQSTIEAILQWILARVGIPYVAPASKSSLLLTSPAFNVRAGDSGALAVHDLLDQVPEVLWFTAAGATLRSPQPGDAAVYSYAPASHPVQGGRLAVQAQALNHVLLYGKANATATAPTLLAEAFDTADGLRTHDVPHEVRDMQLAPANALVRVAAVLRKAQLLTDAGEIAAAPNAGLEVWDAIGATYQPLAPNGMTRRVRELQTEYNALVEGGEYTESVGLMPL